MKPPAVPRTRAGREIAHGARLATQDTELAWGWGSPAGRRRAERRAALIAGRAGLGPGIHALEIGCGTGLFTARFAATGARIDAVDISPDLLDRARARGLPAERVRFIQAAFEECLDLGPFDAVIGSSVLHHLEVVPACAAILRLLKPGGSMAFAEPNLLNPQVFAERRFRHFFPGVSPDETAFVRRRLQGILLRAGFAGIAIVPFDWLHPATPQRLMPLVAAAGRVLEAVPLLREFSGSLLISARRPPATPAGPR